MVRDDCFSKADEVFNYIHNKLNYKLLTPKNYQKENDKFRKEYLAKREYNPQYIYANRSAIDFDAMIRALDDLVFPDNQIGRLYNQSKKALYNEIELYSNIGNTDAIAVLSQKVYGAPNTSYYAKAKETLNIIAPIEKEEFHVDKLVGYMNKCLEYYSFSWKINVSNMMAAKVVTNSDDRIIYINGNYRYSKNDIKRICVHEISSHVLRAENGALRDFDILKNGTANSLATEEGLAIYNEELSGTIKISLFKQYAARFISCMNMGLMSFYEMIQEIEPYIGLEDAIYVVARIKVGLEDTKQIGGLMRDHVYFQGYHDIRNMVKENWKLYEKLYYGSISLEEVYLLDDEIHNAIDENKIILPNWDTIFE